MDLELTNKTALITGSTAGIGFAIAERLALEGARVIVNGRTQERMDAAIAKIKESLKEAGVSGIAADLSMAAGAAPVAASAPTLDILVNTLGIFEMKDFPDITDDDWMRTFETNILSGVRLSRLSLPAMRQRDWGRVVFISSESAVNIPAEMIHYGVTKTAQVALARGLAETTAGTGITVNSVLPGPTRSEGVGTFVQQMAQARGVSEKAKEDEFFQTTRPSSLLKRFAAPEEIAPLVAYLCSPLASATNGAALRVDGGVVRSLF